MLHIYHKSICVLILYHIKSHGYIISENHISENHIELNVISLIYSIHITYDVDCDTIRIYTISQDSNIHFIVSDYYTQAPHVTNMYVFKTLLFIENIDFILNFIFDRILSDIKYLNDMKLLDGAYNDLNSEFRYKFNNIESYIRSNKLSILKDL